jgi:hypothetical protein
MEKLILICPQKRVDKGQEIGKKEFLPDHFLWKSGHKNLLDSKLKVLIPFSRAEKFERILSPP